MSAGTLVFGKGPVRDVFIRERLLVHPGVHVAGVEPVDGDVRLLDRQDVGELFEAGFRRSIPSPPLITLDCGIGGDVHHCPFGRTEVGKGELDQPKRRQEIGGDDLL